MGVSHIWVVQYWHWPLPESSETRPVSAASRGGSAHPETDTRYFPSLGSADSEVQLLKTCVFPTDHPEHYYNKMCQKKYTFILVFLSLITSFLHCTKGFLCHCTLGFIPGVSPECPEQPRALSQCRMCPVSMRPSDWPVRPHTRLWLVNRISFLPLIGH